MSLYRARIISIASGNAASKTRTESAIIWLPTWRETFTNGQRVRDEDGVWLESFDPNAFKIDPCERVPVVISHDKRKPVGYLDYVSRRDDWLVTAFCLDHSLSRSALAIDMLDVGAPVSIGFAPIRRDRLSAEDGVMWHKEDRLEELSILFANETPAFRGAQVVQVIEMLYRPHRASSRQARCFTAARPSAATSARCWRCADVDAGAAAIGLRPDRRTRLARCAQQLPSPSPPRASRPGR